MTVIHSYCPYCGQHTTGWLFIRTVQETGEFTSVCRSCAVNNSHEFVGHFATPDFDSWVNWDEEDSNES